MITLKNVEQATKTIADIKAINTEIKELERMAIVLVDSDMETSFEMTAVEMSKGNTKKSFENFVKGAMFGQAFIPSFVIEFDKNNGEASCVNNADQSTKKVSKTITCKLNTTTSLQILHVLLGDKQLKKTNLINQLQDFGVKI